jgi:hypothetical protein
VQPTPKVLRLRFEIRCVCHRHFIHQPGLGVGLTAPNGLLDFDHTSRSRNPPRGTTDYRVVEGCTAAFPPFAAVSPELSQP